MLPILFEFLIWSYCPGTLDMKKMEIGR